MINIIISVKGTQKICDILFFGYARLINFILQVKQWVYQISGEMHLNYLFDKILCSQL